MFFCILLYIAPRLPAYAVLTHEAINHSAWDSSFDPLLRQRFPQSTTVEVRHALAYAYAGCTLQDVGYYPFGSRFFSDKVHYVRSGDFAINLIQSSQNLDEYAFALGALAHYAADTKGHAIAVNPPAGMQYPKVEVSRGVLEQAFRNTSFRNT
jgi:hypothetical protein